MGHRLEGGVQKEFFQLITPVLFNKDFGATERKRC